MVVQASRQGLRILQDHAECETGQHCPHDRGFPTAWTRCGRQSSLPFPKLRTVNARWRTDAGAGRRCVGNSEKHAVPSRMRPARELPQRPPGRPMSGHGRMVVYQEIMSKDRKPFQRLRHLTPAKPMGWRPLRALLILPDLSIVLVFSEFWFPRVSLSVAKSHFLPIDERR